MVAAAIRLVTTQNVVRAALFLVIVLAGAAAQFLLLAADFVAVVQLVVYVGAIVVLFLFGIMLTRAPIGRTQDLDNDQRWLAAIVGLFLLGVLSTVLVKAFPFEDSAKIDFDLIHTAVNINLVAFGAFHNNIAGQIFALFVIAVAAAEVGVGLAIVLLIYRNLHSIDLDRVDRLRG